MKGDVKRKHFPADGGSWISLASRPCAMESRRSGRRLELDIHAVRLMPTEPGRMQAAGLGLPTMVLSETRGLWLCGVVRGWLGSHRDLLGSSPEGSNGCRETHPRTQWPLARGRG